MGCVFFGNGRVLNAVQTQTQNVVILNEVKNLSEVLWLERNRRAILRFTQNDNANYKAAVAMTSLRAD
jgi:hypothetical protein